MGEDSSPVDREIFSSHAAWERGYAMPLTSARVLASFALKRVYLNSCNFPESMIVVQLIWLSKLLSWNMAWELSTFTGS